MNLPEVAHQHKPSPYPLNPLQLPASVHVHNASAYTDRGTLFVSVMTDDGHVTTYEFEGEPLDALRAALTPSEEDTTRPDYHYPCPRCGSAWGTPCVTTGADHTTDQTRGA